MQQNTVEPDCVDFKIKADKLVHSYSKLSVNLDDDDSETESVTDYLKSWIQLLDEIKVWPPSMDILFFEVTVACNYLIIYLTMNLKDGLMSTVTERLMCQTFRRVSQWAFKISQVPESLHQKESAMESEMRKVVEAVKDPMAHFRLLKILDRVLVLCSFVCLYRKDQENVQKLQETLSYVTELRSLANQTVLKTQVPLVQGMLLATSPDHEKNVNSEDPSVEDLILLVLKSLKVDEQTDVAFKPWQWLDIMLQCENLMKSKDFLSAMKKVESVLRTPLDPERKSKLLCLFAKCYLHQECPQLAIQTYRKALSVDKGNHNVLYELANVYRVVGLADLELESLNLLVRILTDKHKRCKDYRLKLDIDAFIMSVCQTSPDIQLPTALCHFARRCFHLGWYKVSAEQYLTLLHLLDDTETYLLEETRQSKFDCTTEFNVRELIVETAETLVMAEQYTQCISLCDEFYAYLNVETNSVNADQSSCPVSSKDLHVSLESCPTISDNTKTQQSFLFHQCPKSDGNRLTLEFENHNLLSVNNQNIPDSEKNQNNQAVLSQLCSKTLANLSRKRMRLVSTCGNEDENRVNLDVVDKDDWLGKSLAVRLLLSKTDALVASQGFTQDTVDCLTQAHKILMNSKTSVFKPSGLGDCTLPPSQKRRRLNTEASEVDSILVRCEDEVEDLETCRSGGESSEASMAFGQEISPVWSKTMVMVAVRMGRVFLKRQQFSTVLNSCRLILQLDSENINGHYLKTLALREQGEKSHQVSHQWLKERNINWQGDDPKSRLEAAITDKRIEIKKAAATATRNQVKRKWWGTSQVKLLSLDAACLCDILQQFSQ